MIDDFKPTTYSEYGGTARCMTSDGRIVNMDEELNKIDYYSRIKEMEDKLIRDVLNSSGSKVDETNQNYFEEHVCKGGMTETWLVPGGAEFWLIFMGNTKTFTWIEYCPYCGYHPPNLRKDWNNRNE